MSKKSHRLDVVRTLIDTEHISSQEELLTRLKHMGIETTQSTLSRDIKELRVIKVPNPEKGYVYLLPESLRGEEKQTHSYSTIADNIRYIKSSGNIIVIRTKPGYAKAVGVMVDGEDYNEVLGTLAGDDTLFFLLAEGIDPVAFLPRFDTLHPNLKDLYRPTIFYTQKV